MKDNVPFVLIRGLFREKRHWGVFLDILQKTFPNKKIICLDIPGSGERHLECSPSSIDLIVEDLRKDIKESKIDIISISMGGMIGSKWANMYPKEINSLICINTSAKNFSNFFERLMPKNYIKVIKALFFIENREKILYSIVSNKDFDSNTILKWNQYAKEYPIKKFNFFKQLFAGVKFKIEEKVMCKLLFISSMNDKLVPHNATKAIAEAWKSNLIVNKNDGHDIPLDNPNWLCKQIFDFIDK